MDCVKYDFGFMFFYSERPNTYAARKLVDDIPLEVKKRRLAEIIERQQQHSLQRNQAYVGQVVDVLVEGPSKKSPDDLFGRTTQNTVVVFPKKNHQRGDFVRVLVDRCTPATLLGESLTAGVE
jgi:tRNA-2-methylthio-N6-dimethylallyladenosine synthase